MKWLLPLLLCGFSSTGLCPPSLSFFGKSGANVTLATGLLGYWPLDELSGEDRSDWTGNGWTATHSGNTYAFNANLGNGLFDDSSGNSLTVSSSIDTRAQSAPFSFSLWIKSALTRSGNSIAGEWNGSANDWVVTYNGSGAPIFTTHDNASGQVGTTHQTVMVGNTWNHIVCTWDGSNQHIYLNAVKDTDTAHNAAVGVRRADSNLVFDNDSGGVQLPATSMDEIGYWNRALSSTEVTTLYNSGTPTHTGLNLQSAGTARAAMWSGWVVANGGSAPSGGTKTAAATFWDGMINDGFGTETNAIMNMIAPDNLIASLTPLVAGSGVKLWVNHNFVSGDLTVNGLAGDGSTKYADTGVNVSTLFASASDACVALYVYTLNNNTSGGVDFMAIDGSANDLALYTDLDSGGTVGNWDAYSPTGGRVSFSTAANGFYLGSRVSSSSSVIYFANSGSSWASQASTSSTGGTPPAVKMFTWCQDNNGTAGLFSNERISFVGIMHGRTSGQGQNIFNRVQTLRTSLGGGER